MKAVAYRALLVVSVIYVAFMAGLFVAIKQVWPYPAIYEAMFGARDFLRYWKNDLGIEPTRHLTPAEPGRAAVTIAHKDRIADGYRLILGLTPGHDALFGARLIDIDGKELHYWPIDYDKIDPGGRKSQNTIPHGFEVFEDGSIAVNFDGGDVLTRLGSCGEVRWRMKGDSHHAISRSYDGTLWSLLNYPPGGNNQNLVQIDAETGRILRRVFVKDDLMLRHGMPGVFAIPAQEVDAFVALNYPEHDRLSFPFDYLHLNDLETLSPELAGTFPLFAAGDILISMRNINLVAVLDGKTLEVKWWQHGPWHRQHDPDFLPNGRISVFNNNTGLARSNIIEIDPVSRKFEIVLNGDDTPIFYTGIRGKHEYLKNGNILVTEAQRGRVVEATRDGTVVWEFQNIFDETRNGFVTDARYIPEDFFRPGSLDCPSR